MNKKLIALAVAGAVFAPAVMAQSANPVTLYGTLNVDMETVKAVGATGTGANASSRNRVSSNSSNFGIRGTDDLGGGLKAFFQIEMGSVPMDSGYATLNAAINGVTALAGRNSAVGLQGSAGSVLVGNWDTPYKFSTGDVDAFYGTGISHNTDILSGNSTPTDIAGNVRQGFDRRSGNSFQYWTPNVSGFSGRFAYSANENKTNSAAAVQQSPSITSYAGIYSSGTLYLALAHERHEQFANTATASTADRGTKFSGMITFGTTKLGLLAEQLKFNGNLAATGLAKTFTVGTSTQAKINSYYFTIRHGMGPFTLRAAYGTDRGVKLDAGTADQTQARLAVFGASYSFSKRTDLYGVYTKVTNQINSRNNFAINGISSVNGADPTGLGVGLRHTF